MTKQVSQLARQLMGNAGVKFYTQQEFDTELMLAKAEIMAVAIETSKRVVLLERESCAQLCDAMEFPELAEAIRNRIPTQRQ